MSTAATPLERTHAWPRATRLVLACAAVIAAVGLVHLLAIRAGHDWGDDFAMYILHAQNLASGRAFADTPYVYNPANAELGPPSYPPITSALLAPVIYFRGLDLVAMKGVMIGSLLAALALMAVCFARRLAASQLTLLLALVGLNTYFLRDTSGIGSDAPFLAFLFLALWTILRMEPDDAGPRPKLAWGLAAGVAIYLAFGTRAVGGVLLPTLWAADLVRNRRPSAAAIVATMAFGGLALLQGLLGHNDRGYLDQLPRDPAVLADNAWHYATRMVAFWNNGYSKALSAVVFAVFTALAASGYARSVRGRITVLEIFPVFYMGVIFLFPAYQGERFLFPILPFYVYYAVLGLESPWLALRPGLARVAVPVLVTAALATYVARYTSWDFGPIAEGPHRRESAELFRYLTDHTSPDAVVLFAKPRALALYTGRHAAAYQPRADDAAMWQVIDRTGANYVVAFANDRPLAYEEDRRMADELRRFAGRNRARLQTTYQNPDFVVYEILPEHAACSAARIDPLGRGRAIAGGIHRSSTLLRQWELQP